MRNIKHGNHVRLTDICHHCRLKEMDEMTLARLEDHLTQKKLKRLKIKEIKNPWLERKSDFK